jgi:capsular polysaccharide biosynthesis protein
LEEIIACYAELGDKTSIKELMAMITETVDEMSEDCEEIEQSKERDNWRAEVKNTQWRKSMQDEIHEICMPSSVNVMKREP